MLKIAFIGAGWFANHVHGPALAHYAAEHPGVLDLAAVVVRRSLDKAQAFCRDFGFQRVYTDLDEMLDKEKPDACWVVTPIDQTRRVAGHVLERGLPAFIEKPPGSDLAEARELAAIAARAGLPNLVAFNRRWAPCTRQALSWAKSLGPIEYLYARMLRPNRMDEHFAFGTGIHLLDCLRHLAEQTVGGLTSAVTARALSGPAGALVSADMTRDPDSTALDFHVDMTFASGARGRCDILPACGRLEESYTLIGHKQSIVYHLPWAAGALELPGRAELWQNGDLVASTEYAYDPPHLSTGVYGENAEFIEALLEGRPPSPSLPEVVGSVALAEAVQAGRTLREQEEGGE